MTVHENVSTPPALHSVIPGIFILLILCLLPVAVIAATTEQAKLVASDGAAFGLFGQSVAISGDTALVGAIANVDGNTNQGAAYIFVRDDQSWSEQARFALPDGAAFDNFGASVALSDDGNTALVGAFQVNANGNTNQGAAYIFTRSGEDWSGPVMLAASDGAAGDNFGSSVALAGDGQIALIGVPSARIDGANGRGAAYVFALSDGVWSEQLKLIATDGSGGDQFGFSVALSGNTALLGAPGVNVDGNFGQGAVYAFVSSGGEWSEQAKFIAADGVMFGGFGLAVDLSGDTALVGASTNAAYVFARSGGEWSEQAKLSASDAAPNSGFGGSVALSGDTALVGARSASVDGNNGQGAAYTFVRSGESWTEQAKLIASDGAAFEAFGISLAWSDDTALVGAFNADVDDNFNQGAAYVFQFGPDPSGPDLQWVESSAVNFCQVEVGTTSSPQTATLHNAGDTDATGLSFTGLPDSGFEADTSGCGETLPAGESCPVHLTFTPAAPGPATATLQADSAADAEAALSLAGTGVTGQPVEHETMLLSRAGGTCGDKGNARSFFASISADGRFVAFDSDATNLHPDATGHVRGVFVRDAGEQETILVSRASGADGEMGNAVSYRPAISANGRYVVFDSEATNLHPDATDDLRDVYLRDLQTHDTILVSRAGGADGAKGNANSFLPSVSDDGRYVAFYSFAYNLHPDANVLQLQVFVRDVVRDETHVVSRASGDDGAVGQLASRNPAISGNGRYVAFESNSANIHPDKTDTIPDIFVRDLETQELYLASRASGEDGVKGNGFSERPRLSADGRYVVFQSHANNLHPDDTDTGLDVYVRDMQTHETLLVSRADGVDGDKGDNVSQEPAISADGRHVAFQTRASNIHPDKTDIIFDVLVRDLGVHETLLASRASGAGGAKGNANSIEPSISGDGHHVAFYSLATNLHPDDSDEAQDVYRRDLGEPPGVPALAFDPPSLDFGEVAVGVSSPPRNATLENIGGVDLSGIAFALHGDGYSADTSACGTDLPAGASCPVSVTFTPTALGPADAALAVDSNEGAGADLSLTGTGIEPKPDPGELDVSPVALDFGEVVVGAIRTDSLTVTNAAESGAAPIALSLLEVTTGAPAFTISGGDCSVGTSLEPGDSCTVEVSFGPDANGAFTGQMDIATTDGQSQSVQLSGSGIEPIPSVDEIFDDRFESEP